MTWDIFEKISEFLACYFTLIRLFKAGTVIHFFQRSEPMMTQEWPAISLIQPITRGAANLEHNLKARLHLDYPAALQHILVCDAANPEIQLLCQGLQTDAPLAKITVLTVEPERGEIASKIVKLNTALAVAEGKVLCFIDDDIAPRSTALKQMIPYLLRPGVGATFGLACAGSWNTIWSSLMSSFVNLNALMSYIPISYLTEPFTITGHIFAVTRQNFEAAGGFQGMAGRVDDDHELARRLQAIQLKSVQTPVIYDIYNEFFSWQEYENQMKRWFIIPRQTMLPYLSGKQTFISGSLSLDLWIPPLVTLLALLFPSPITWLSWVMVLGGCLGGFAISCFYLKISRPVWQSLWVPAIAILSPIQILLALLGNNEIVWRGQNLRLEKGGVFQVLK